MIRLRLLASAALIVAIALVVPANSGMAASAATAVGLTTTGTSQLNQLLGVSCPTASFCAAVGVYTPDASTDTLIEQWDGAAWNMVASPNANSTQNALYGVSCSSDVFCMAIGTYQFNGSNAQTLIEEWDGSAWNIVPSPNTDSTQSNHLQAVSCAGPTFCVAVGQYQNSGATWQTLVETWDGSSWSVASSPNTSSTQFNDLNGVSCASSALCMAVGESSDSVTGQTLIEQWDGTAWNIVPSPSPSNNPGLRAVSCVSGAFCAAVGQYTTAGAGNQTLIETWDGISWTTVASPNSGNGGDDLRSIACISAGSCMATGLRTSPPGFQYTLVDVWDGTTWAVSSSPNAIGNDPHNVPTNYLPGVSCSAASSCMAVGYWNGSVGDQVLVEQWDGNTWSLGGGADRAAVQATGPGSTATVRAAYAPATRTQSSGNNLAVLARTVSSRLPTVKVKWSGVFDPAHAPSASTGAVGPSRYVEVSNAMFGIYDRTVSPPLTTSTGSLTALSGDCASCVAKDPQVIWDPTTNRFYYSALDITAATTGTGSNYLLFGFSKGATPNGVADWCQYIIGNGLFGFDVPDSPKLGDSQSSWLIGINLYHGSGSFADAQVVSGNKPAGTGVLGTCPSTSSFASGVTTLRTSIGTAVGSPVPASEVDTNSNGYVVANPSPPGTATMSAVLLYSVAAASGSAIIGRPTSLAVTSYSIPASAPQKGSAFLLDTGDTRLAHAIGAIDPLCASPSGGSAFTVWTQHAVRGGSGSIVRWYEINTASGTLCQQGSASRKGLYLFDPAVSPDRMVSGAIGKFGSNMVLGYESSSTTTDVAVWTSSSRAHAAAGTAVKVVAATGPYTDGFTCPAQPVGVGTCGWGTSAGASPDPNPALATAKVGEVWLTAQYNANSVGSGGSANWRTENWATAP